MDPVSAGFLISGLVGGSYFIATQAIAFSSKQYVERIKTKQTFAEVTSPFLYNMADFVHLLVGDSWKDIVKFNTWKPEEPDAKQRHDLMQNKVSTERRVLLQRLYGLPPAHDDTNFKRSQYEVLIRNGAQAAAILSLRINTEVSKFFESGCIPTEGAIATRYIRQNDFSTLFPRIDHFRYSEFKTTLKQVSILCSVYAERVFNFTLDTKLVNECEWHLPTDEDVNAVVEEAQSQFKIKGLTDIVANRQYRHFGLGTAISEPKLLDPVRNQLFNSIQDEISLYNFLVEDGFEDDMIV